MNIPTDKEVRDWYMGYGVEGRAELAEVEGDAFDRYLLERDAKVAKAAEERIIKLLEPLGECEPSICGKGCRGEYRCIGWAYRHAIRLIKGENK